MSALSRGDVRAQELRFRHRVRVGYIDTDRGGVVHHSAYLRFCEAARIELLREIGIVYRELEDTQRLALPVAEVRARYRAPARFDDELEVVSAVSRASRASLTFDQRVMRGDLALVTAEIVLACVALPAEKVTSVPAWLRQKLGFAA